MKSSLIALSLLFISSTALACGDFDECMNKEETFVNKSQANYMKAIAYKLDEMSKELKVNKGDSDDGMEYYPENAKNPDDKIYVKEMCGDGCVRWFDPVHRVMWSGGEAGSAIACKKKK